MLKFRPRGVLSSFWNNCRENLPDFSDTSLWAKAGAAIVIMYLMVGLDILGIDALLRKNSEFLGNRFLAYFYPQQESDALIILFDDDYLKNALAANKDALKEEQINASTSHGSWPAEFSHHNIILKRILKSQPRAVFYDILFIPRTVNTDIDLFITTLNSAKKQTPPVPVFMACHPESSLHSQIYNQFEPEDFAAVSWEGQGFFYPTASGYIAKVEGESRCFNKNTEQREQKTSVSPLPTAAFRLYNGYSKEKFTDNLYVYWGDRPDDGNNNPPPDKQPWKRRLEQSLAMMLSPQKTDKTLYIPSYGVRDLAGKNRSQLKKIIENKTVFIGTDITGLPDRVNSPTNGKVPGVFLHAMAFDNLVKFGKNYRVDGERGRFLGFDWADFVELILLAFIIFLFWLFRCLKEAICAIPPCSDIRKAWKTLGLSLCFFVLSYAVILTVLYFTWEIKRWDFGNFLGMLSISIPVYTLLEACIELPLIPLFSTWKKNSEILF